MSARLVNGRIGSLVRERRLGLGLSQVELARRVGISQTYLSNMERGRVQLPDVDVRRRRAEALCMSHVELLVAAGELDAHELPGDAEAVKPVVVGLSAKIDELPSETRRAIERIIDDLHAFHTSGTTPAVRRDR
jgi:transcriptional regulator with XRE-family HTH domain